MHLSLDCGFILCFSWIRARFLTRLACFIQRKWTGSTDRGWYCGSVVTRRLARLYGALLWIYAPISHVPDVNQRAVRIQCIGTSGVPSVHYRLFQSTTWWFEKSSPSVACCTQRRGHRCAAQCEHVRALSETARISDRGRIAFRSASRHSWNWILLELTNRKR